MVKDVDEFEYGVSSFFDVFGVIFDGIESIVSVFCCSKGESDEGKSVCIGFYNGEYLC